jgi:hypothetical protein
MIISDATVRSRTTIVKGLLRRAFNGESAYTLEQMKAMIAERLARARDIPEAQRLVLEVIRAVEKDCRDYETAMKDAGVPAEEITPPSRALKNLSISERLNGRAVSYHTVPESVQAVSADLEVRPDLNPARITLTPRAE